MVRACTLLIAVGALALAIAATLSVMRSLERGPVYAVAQVQAGLARDPHAWVGRTLLVRGAVVPCVAGEDYACAALAPSAGSPAAGPLPVLRAGLDPFRAGVRRLPVLGELLPAPQELHWGAVATDQVRVRAISESFCGVGVCFEAVLLDAAPDALPGE